MNPELNPWIDPTVYQIGIDFASVVERSGDDFVVVRLETGALAYILPGGWTGHPPSEGVAVVVRLVEADVRNRRLQAVVVREAASSEKVWTVDSMSLSGGQRDKKEVKARFMRTHAGMTSFARVKIRSEPEWFQAAKEGIKRMLSILDESPSDEFVIIGVQGTIVDTTPDAVACAAGLAVARLLGQDPPQISTKRP